MTHNLHILYIDLGDASGRAVRVSAEGWSIVAEPPVRFRRAAGMKPYPEPVAGGEIADLKRLLACPSEESFRLIMGFILGVFAPHGPYPILLLRGPKGSGKSVRGELVKLLVDPHEADKIPVPKEDRDLLVAAIVSWVPHVDNIHSINQNISDIFCMLATGVSHMSRKLYSNADVHIAPKMSRPLILNGIDPRLREDLVDRCLSIKFPLIQAKKRMTENEIRQDFEAMHSRLFGLILDTLVAIMQNYGKHRPESLPRLADHAMWVTAAESKLGWEPGSYAQLLIKHQKEQMKDAKSNNLVVQLMRNWIDRWEDVDRKRDYFRTAEILDAIIELDRRKGDNLPQTPTAFSRKLRELDEDGSFAIYGISFEFGVATKGEKRGIRIHVESEEEDDDDEDSVERVF